MNPTLVLTDGDVGRIAEALAVRVQLPVIAVTTEQLQSILNCPSKWATQQELRDLGVKPYRRGKYRLRDIDNAVARRSRT